MRVRAVPEDGKANAAVEALVSTWLDVARSRVAVIGGHTSRHKSIAVAGADAAVLARLQSLLGHER